MANYSYSAPRCRGESDTKNFFLNYRVINEAAADIHTIRGSLRRLARQPLDDLAPADLTRIRVVLAEVERVAGRRGVI